MFSGMSTPAKKPWKETAVVSAGGERGDKSLQKQVEGMMAIGDDETVSGGRNPVCTWNSKQQTTSSLWLFQLEDSKSVHGKWLEITKHPLKTGCLEFQVVTWNFFVLYFGVGSPSKRKPKFHSKQQGHGWVPGICIINWHT